MSSKLLKHTSESTITKDNWKDKKKKLMEKFPHLSDTDLSYQEGKLEDMVNKLHAKIGKIFGKTKDDLLKFIESL